MDVFFSVTMTSLIVIFSVLIFFEVGWYFGYRNRERKAELAHAATRDAFDRDIKKASDDAYCRGFTHGVENERERIRDLLGE